MALVAGDFAFIGFNADGTDGFAIVALVAIPAGTVVYFRDDEWSATTSTFSNTSEGIITWTVGAGGLAAGATVEFAATSTTTPTVTSGAVTVSGSLNLGASNEVLYAYTSTGTATTGTFTFVTAFANSGFSVANGEIGTGLTAGTNANNFTTGFDVFAYSPALGGSTFATQAAALTALTNTANWVSQDGTGNQDADTTTPDVPFLTNAPLSGNPFSIGAAAATTVNLSVSTNTGTEAGTTVVTVTATASAAVTGVQTVNLAVTGTGITAGDYNLSNTVITIANGATTGTVTFTVVDDLLAEALETAVLTISSPSAGISLGSTVTQNIVITDNDAAPSLIYTNPTLNEANPFNGSISGKTVITLTGDTFTGTNGENLITTSKATVTNVPAVLTAVLTRTSATTAELSYTGTATDNANANDVSNVTVTFANTAFTGANAASITASTKADLGINFADIGTAGTVQTFTPNTGTTRGSSDASTAIALDANFTVVGDDEANVLRVYDRAGGPAVLEYSYASIDPLLAAGELDLEASTRIGDTLYFMGSHSNSRTGNEANNREFIFSVTVSGTGANTVFTTGGKYGGLEGALSTWDSSNAHTKGANYFGFTASSAAGVVPETTGGFSIEGMTASQDSTQLLLAFRAPQTTTTARDKAVIVPVTVASIFTGTPVFGAPIELNLGGRGIRSIEKSSGGTDYLILAGPAGSASTDVTNDFRLFRWDGISTSPVELNVSLDALRNTTLGSFESIVDVQNTAQGTLVQLLQDNGDTRWPGKSVVADSKDLPAAEQQFQGNWISIGANVAADVTAPTLASATPADDAASVAPNANLVLRFNEGVKAGTGNFVIRKVSDNSIVESISVSDAKVTIAFNTVTINPAATLDPSTAYYVEAVAGTLTDTANNNWAGLTGNTAYNFTTSASFVAPQLLITEVNSLAGPSDFFELYNFGTTAIDLTGWKWDDDSANFNDTAAATFGAVGIAAGERVIVINTTDVAAFRAAWNNLPNSTQVIATGGPGLGSPDAVALFDPAGNLATSLNLTAASITSSATTVIASAARVDTLAIVAGHAGASVGGTATTSAVWDGLSTTAPAYTFAKVGEFGGFAQTAAIANIGSPGAIPTAGTGASVTTPVLRPFTATLGDFTVFSVDIDTVNTWVRNTAGYVEVNGFGDTAPANDWLISRGFNLNQTDAEFLSFTTWTRFLDTAIATPQVKVRYSLDYIGNGTPTAAVWTDLSYVPSPQDSQTITPSGLINLAGISGTNVHFAFQYTSTSATNAASWRVDDFRIEGFAGSVLSIAPTTTSLTEGETGSQSHIFTVTRTGNTAAAATVNWAVTGAASSPANATDFGGTLPSGTVTFAANETTATITVNATGDTTPEINENFVVTLSGASAGTTIIAPTATGTIVSDDAAVVKIHTLQGSGAATTFTGASANGLTVEGIVTAFKPDLQGFYMQEELPDQDGNAATSEGIFVFYGTTPPAGLNAASVGDIVRVTGNVIELTNSTAATNPGAGQLAGTTALTGISGFQTITAGTTLPTAVSITLPVANLFDWEAVEGMLVTVTSATVGGKLVVTDNFNYGRYGQLALTSDELLVNFTETNTPSVANYSAYVAVTQRDQIVVDDSTTAQNTNLLGANGQPLSASNTLRAGSSTTSVTGVINQSTANPSSSEVQTPYRIQTLDPVVYTAAARPSAADLPANVTGAEIKVASVNVLNYFTSVGSASPATTFVNPNGTTHDARGANTAAEFARQQNKLVASILGLNADVVGLMEMQNNGFGDGTSGIDALTDALNAATSAGTYAYVAGPYPDSNGAPSATAGDDAIMVAFLYKPSKVSVEGTAAVPDVALPAYTAFTSTYGSRVPVAVTFKAIADNELFTVVSNHFKSKSSATALQGLDANDGAGRANTARDLASTQLLQWLATNPTGTLDTDVLLIGDLNAYSKEQPITTLLSGGYTKVSTGLSYSFNGLWGSLDHALANASLNGQVTGAVKWGINAEEPTVLDYNTEFKSAAQVTGLFAADAYRSSDHNPVLIGLNLDSPAVNLSVSSTSGSEATAGTAITVTATLATASSKAQTVNVSVAGTGITAGDFTLSNAVLTIAANALTGTVNFNVVDDALNEGPETAVITLSAPSAGIRLGATVSQNVVIADNDAPAPAPAPAPMPTPVPVPIPTPVPVPIPTPVPVPTPDTDGVPDAVENTVPGLVTVIGTAPLAGDGNGDGVPDGQQSGVTSVAFLQTTTAQTNPGTATPTFVTLVADSRDGKIDTADANTATLTNVRQLNAPANLPAEINMPLGLIAFSATVGLNTGGAAAVGVSETFSLYADPSLQVNGYWKQNTSGTWVNLASEAFGGKVVTEGGKTRLDFQLTDGGPFDSDGRIDGVITDPGAAASMPLSLVGYAPTLADGTQFWF